jgi:hypothetical protein
MGYAMGWQEGDTTLVPVPLTHIGVGLGVPTQVNKL